ncbi:MAG TPA: hypothetical protein VNH46_02265, partial [Gemmatimonadales bacterium]|nr:hypothetical protein [Gemmatimonadales bacterium]
MRAVPALVLVLVAAAPGGVAAQSLEQATKACDQGDAVQCRDSGERLEQRAEYDRAAGYYQRGCDG